jgi:hypothetical protein
MCRANTFGYTGFSKSIIPEVTSVIFYTIGPEETVEVVSSEVVVVGSVTGWRSLVKHSRIVHLHALHRIRHRSGKEYDESLKDLLLWAREGKS